MPNRGSSLSLKSTIIALAVVAIAICGLEQPLNAQAKPGGLASVLAQMNTASANFTNAQADLRQELYTKAIHNTEAQNGQIYFVHHDGAIRMGMDLLAPDAASGSAPVTVVHYQSGVLQVLTVGTNQIDQFPATGKNQATAETMMTLGFGVSGHDLEKAWTITDDGREKLEDGGKPVEVEKFDLVSKDPAIRKIYSHITIWVDPVRDVPLKQISFDASSGDTRTVIYSNIRLNQSFNSGYLDINCKGKCTVVNH
jgi:hypothetical protein